MSLAGPGANLTIAILAGLSIHAGMLLGWFEHPDSANFTHIVEAAKPGAAGGAAFVLSILFSLNLLLCVFNLLPIPPLDGFGAVGLLLSENSATKFQQFGHQMRGYSIFGLLVAWRIFDPLFDPVFTLALRVLYPTQNYGG
jgi:Zn-dependent protease